MRTVDDEPNPWVTALAQERARRVAALRRALRDARRRDDRQVVAVLLQWLSDEAVGGAA